MRSLLPRSALARWALGILVALALLAAIGPLPSWIVAWTVQGGLNADQWARAVSEERRSVLLVLGGLIAVVTLYYTARRHALSEDANRTDRYSAAIGHLGSEYVEVRTGGVYALERIMRESERDRAAISDVLCAFVRARAVNRYDQDTRTFSPIPIDVDAAVRVISRRGSRGEGYPPADLADTDLSGVYIPGAQLANANLQGCTLFHADLSGADLSGARLSGAILTAANLRQAEMFEVNAGYSADFDPALCDGLQLQRADLRDSRWTGCNFHIAQLMDVSAVSANFDHTKFNSAVLSGDFSDSDFYAAAFNETSVAGAFNNADLRHASGSTSSFNATFDGADLTDARFGGCNFTGSAFDGAVTQSATNDNQPLV